jgi:cation diffusion facilitator family transporter
MFSVEAVVGLLAASTALLADSLDMLGDALVYAFSLLVVGRSVRWRAGAALLKGIIMLGFGAVVLAQAIYRTLVPEVPDFGLMGATAGLALAANAACLYLLTRHRDDDLNMRSTWLCSRNDIIANLGVLAAAGAVFATGSRWPDLAIGLIITAVYARSAVSVLARAVEELRHPVEQPRHVHPATEEAWQPVELVLVRCVAGTCPAGACRCGLG